MKLLFGVGVALAFQSLYTAFGHGGGDVDTLKDQLGLLRDDLHNVRLELRQKSNLDVIERKRRGNLQKQITRLQMEVSELRSERASAQRLPANLLQGLSAEKQIRGQIRNDLKALKATVRLNVATISSLQAAANLNYTDHEARLSALQKKQSLCKCSSWSRETDTEGLKVDPGLEGEPEGSEEKGEPNTMVLRGGQTVSVPLLRFTQAYGSTPDRVIIQANGAVVKDGSNLASRTTVHIDGLVTTDHGYYWETELKWRRPGRISGWWWVSSVGVRREGSDFSVGLGYEDQLWAVVIRDNFVEKKWLYECRHGGKTIFTSQPVSYTNPEVITRLGFLFLPAEKTLTVVDANNHARWCSFPAGDVESKPLVPAVRFGISIFQRKFRLPAINPSPDLKTFLSSIYN